jgi:hypothetical protein
MQTKNPKHNALSDFLFINSKILKFFCIQLPNNPAQ